MRILKPIITIISVFMSIGYGIALVNTPNLNVNTPFLRYFLYGFVGFIPLWFIWGRKTAFFSIFEHEFTHLLVGILFFRKPHSFAVNESEGGAVSLYGGNFLITLAPYFLPTFTYILLPFYFIINPKFYLYYFALLGFLTSYHILSTMREFSYKQPDIIKSGKVFSTFFLLFANIFVYGFLIAFIIGGFKEAGLFIKKGFFESENWIMLAIQKIKSQAKV